MQTLTQTLKKDKKTIDKLQTKDKTRNMNCPVCGESLDVIEGSQLNRADGITLYCPNRKCSAQEVAGHGANFEKAYDIIKQKFPQKTLTTQTTEVRL